MSNLDTIWRYERVRRLPGGRLWWRWTVAMTLGELVGFALALAVAGGLYMAARAAFGDVPDTAMILGAPLAGIIEGSIVGLAQWWVMRHYLPQVRRGTWVLATVAGAVIAYLLGTLVGTGLGGAVDPSTWNIGLQIGLGIIYVATLGATLGATQWVVLRRYLDHAGWWIAANAGGWIFGLAVGLTGPSLIDNWDSIPLVAGVGAITGLLMGALVGAITGGALVWLLHGNTDHHARDAHA